MDNISQRKKYLEELLIEVGFLKKEDNQWENEKDKMCKRKHKVLEYSDKIKNEFLDFMLDLKENSQENFIYSLEKESLNKKLLKYYINNEKIPNYFVEGKGVKIYLNNVLQSAKLELRSGEEEKFEREIHLNIEKE